MNENGLTMSEETIRLEYNTEREKLRITEYGRNVLKMVEHLKEIPDKAKRSEQARAVVKTMELLNPSVKTQEDWEHKLWDQLYIIAEFDLDIDAPYPCPVKEEFETSPVPLPMKGSKIKATHYGRNIETIIELLCNEPDGEMKTAMIRSLATYMRTQYLIWNKDSVADETIFASRCRRGYSSKGFRRMPHSPVPAWASRMHPAARTTNSAIRKPRRNEQIPGLYLFLEKLG